MSSTSIHSIFPAIVSRRNWPLWLRSTSAEVWVKFLLALIGLALAFGAALFSTASGEAGHLWASIILASAALLLAAFVGLVTVPYLARRAALERFRHKFHWEVTKAGVGYVLVTLVIGIAALNTGNNLLYIVVAAMIAAILVSGIVSALVLQSLELDIRLPEHVFATRAVTGRVVLHNRRRFLPSFSIRVVPIRKEKRDRKEWRWEPTTFAFPANRPPQDQWLRMRDWRVHRVKVDSAPPGIFEGLVYFPYLPAKSHSSAELPLLFQRRGRHRETGFGVSTRFPFAFLTKTREVELQKEIIVYPRIDPPNEILEILPVVRGEWESFLQGRGSDLYRIREYLPEDSVRHVDWKATAKSGSLKVREFTREDERKLCIVFDNPVVGSISDSEYERAVNLAASLAWHFSSQNSDVTFWAGDHARCKDVNEFLAQLAVIQPRHEDFTHVPERDPLHQLHSQAGGEYNVVLTSRPRGGFPSFWWSSSYFIFFNANSPQIATGSERMPSMARR